MSLAQRGLDVVLLHQLLLEKGLGITPAAVSTERNLTYERDMDAAIAAVDEERAQICFLLNPVGVEQVTEMALAGEVLPQKIDRLLSETIEWSYAVPAGLSNTGVAYRSV